LDSGTLAGEEEDELAEEEVEAGDADDDDSFDSELDFDFGTRGVLVVIGWCRLRVDRLLSLVSVLLPLKSIASAGESVSFEGLDDADEEDEDDEDESDSDALEPDFDFDTCGLFVLIGLYRSARLLSPASALLPVKSTSSAGESLFDELEELPCRLLYDADDEDDEEDELEGDGGGDGCFFSSNLSSRGTNGRRSVW